MYVCIISFWVFETVLPVTRMVFFQELIPEIENAPVRKAAVWQ